MSHEPTKERPAASGDPFPRLEVSDHHHSTANGATEHVLIDAEDVAPKRRRMNTGSGRSAPNHVSQASAVSFSSEDGQQWPGLMVPEPRPETESRRSSMTSLIPVCAVRPTTMCHADWSQPLRTLKGSPKEKFRATALVIMIFQKVRDPFGQVKRYN